MRKIIVAIVGAAVLIALIALWPFAIVHAGERGVLLTWGAASGTVLEPGLHVISPVGQRVVNINVQTQKVEVAKSEAYSHDLQVVDIHSAINFHARSESVAELYNTVGVEYTNTLILPQIEVAIKQAIAQYTAEELLTKRAEVQEKIEATLIAALKEKPIVIEKYALVNEAFSTAFENSIERKQVAEQDAFTSKNKLEQTKFEAEQRVTQAKAEAEAIKIQAEAITQQGGENYVQLQAIQKWDGKLPTQFVPGSAFPFLNLK